MTKPMDLETWREKVGSHLIFIESGSQMTVRHANALPGRPEWETLAENDLARARKVLEEALASIIEAQAIYAGKPIVERQHAAA
jgi:hypothetical protein